MNTALAMTQTYNTTLEHKNEQGAQKVIFLATKHTPELKYDGCNHTLWIKGNCDELDMDLYFEKVNILVAHHFENNDQLKTYIHIQKINNSALKGLMNLFNQFRSNFREYKQPEVFWFTSWNDEAMFDLAFDFSELHDFKVKILPV